LARSDSSYVAAPGKFSSEPLHLNDVASLRRVDIIHIYLTWPQRKHFEEAYWRRTLSSYSDASGVGTALPPPNIAVELQTGNC
jgi:hypothetical protein